MTMNPGDWKLAEEINDSPALMSVYAAPQWDELSNDGKAWVAALVAEATRRAAEHAIVSRAANDVPDRDPNQGGPAPSAGSQNVRKVLSENRKEFSGEQTRSVPAASDLAAADDVIAIDTVIIDNLKTRLADAEALVYVPGQWRCAKCNFTHQQMVLSASTGTIAAQDKPGEQCPNCRSPLWRTTWKQEASEMLDRATEQMEARKSAEACLKAIDELTAEEAETVTLCSRNADFNGLPNDCVTVNASWTDWKDRDFRAETRQQCLDLAVEAKARAEADVEYDKVFAQLDKLGTGRCDSCGRKVPIGDLDAKPERWDLVRTAILHPISSIRFGLLETCAHRGVNFTRLECRDCYGWRHVEGPST